MRKFLLLFVVLLCLGGMGCGGGDAGGDQIGFQTESSNCTFKLSDITNGQTRSTATSYWKCTGENTGYIALYADGTGESSSTDLSNLEGFTWHQTGCNSLDTTDSDGVTEVTNIKGSISSGIYTFTASNTGQSGTVSCTLYKP